MPTDRDDDQATPDGFMGLPFEDWPVVPRHVGVPGTLHGRSVDPSPEHMAELIEAAETFARRIKTPPVKVHRYAEACRLEAALEPLRALGCQIGTLSDGHGWDPFILEKVTDIDRVFIALTDRWGLGSIVGREDGAEISRDEWVVSAEELAELQASIDLLKTEIGLFTAKVASVRPEPIATPATPATSEPPTNPSGVDITRAYGWFAYGPGCEKGGSEKITIYLRFVADGPWMPWQTQSDQEIAYLAGLIDAQGEPRTYALIAELRPDVLKESASSSRNQTRLRESLIGRAETEETPAKKGKLPPAHAALIFQEYPPTGPYRLLNPPSL
jgi:hypothetical protein